MCDEYFEIYNKNLLKNEKNIDEKYIKNKIKEYNKPISSVT